MKWREKYETAIQYVQSMHSKNWDLTDGTVRERANTGKEYGSIPRSAVVR